MKINITDIEGLISICIVIYYTGLKLSIEIFNKIRINLLNLGILLLNLLSTLGFINTERVCYDIGLPGTSELIEHDNNLSNGRVLTKRTRDDSDDESFAIPEGDTENPTKKAKIGDSNADDLESSAIPGGDTESSNAPLQGDSNKTQEELPASPAQTQEELPASPAQPEENSNESEPDKAPYPTQGNEAPERENEDYSDDSSHSSADSYSDGGSSEPHFDANPDPEFNRENVPGSAPVSEAGNPFTIDEEDVDSMEDELALI